MARKLSIHDPALFHSEDRYPCGGIYLSERRPHVYGKLRHDRPNRRTYQFLGPLPHGVFFLLARNLRLRLFLAVVDANCLLVQVDGHELVAIPVNAVFETRSGGLAFFGLACESLMP